MASQHYRIGGWTFRAGENELVQGGERRRLEDRAARTLELLCRRVGEAVGQDEIVAEVWNGRSQSPNSIPVVIGQLRRALGDDARSPRFIETLPKRGYRLVAEAEPEVEAPRRSRRTRTVAFALLLLLAAAAAWLALRPAAPVLAVSDVVNATGDSAYDPLARATSELIAVGLSRRGLVFRRGAARDGETRLAARLTLWTGEPTIGFTATDPDGAVRWSAMARGPAEKLPGNVDRALDAFVERRVAR
ncbi:MAG: winged helix-turn-helix domain-containing protein [Allosphingosinicella sp.]